jgi:hypothetical protein
MLNSSFAMAIRSRACRQCAGSTIQPIFKLELARWLLIPGG